MQRWFERKFRFDLPVEEFTSILKRLRGSADRMEAMVRGVKREVLIRRDGENWSMQEHLGHLLDLDELHIARLDDFEAGLKTLRPADLDNRKTWEAEHNRRQIGELIADFRRERQHFTDRLAAYDRTFLAKVALHPRLNQPMRVIDMALFVAEHDDHHLAKAEEIKRKLGASV